ncbi:acetyl-CoA hydrolase/transferase family protein [Sphingomonas sp. MMS24-J13]|uniref:acetyl-CoA hydrolase/transferase family protein n=1 Tax=Sphingomonas sp. MMS24-J13 TaxID=3238686 RepID=UPI00384CF933
MTSDAMLYRSRIMTADQAIALIPSGAKVAMGLGVSQPPALLRALADRAAACAVSDIHLYYMLSTAIAGETVLRYELRDRIRPICLFHSPVERALDARAAAEGAQPVDVIPVAFSQVPRVLCEHIGVDTLLITVSPMDEDGNFSFGTDTDYALAVSRTAKRVILEVNPNMPRVHGDCVVHVSRVTAIVEHEIPLLEVPGMPLHAEDVAIGAIIAGLVEDGACIQMGIGALPDAVCAALRQHRHLGIHTELMAPGLVELMRLGVVDNSRKQINQGRSVFTFAMGDKALYDFMDGNPLLEAHPVDYVNDPAVIARNARMISVNATLQVNLDGACNSECMNGRQYSAAGGQLDFVRGAYASKGGRSIIACHSTAAKGTISRIVPALDGPVTTPRNDTHIIVTEHGWADLKGKTVDERARALIGLAHPDFRETLERAAHEKRQRTATARAAV